MMKDGKPAPLPDYALLLECFEYDPVTGLLLWRARPRSHFKSDRGWKIFTRQCAGKPAGTLNTNGYLRTGLGGRGMRRYYVHQIIYKMMTGIDPPQIDHRNRVRTDNWWDNLRAADASGNAANQKLRSTNTSGFKGVSFYDGVFNAEITAQGKKIRLGRFTTAQAAADAYSQAAVKLQGEFYPS